MAITIVRIAATAASCALTFAGMSPVTGATAANSSQSTPAPSTISAPAAAEPVIMDCVEGQIDINNPNSNAFAPLSAPDGVPLGEPVRKRMVEGQPYLQPSDLLAVSGLTPAHIGKWIGEGSVCATPQVLPPPAPDVCLDEVDVNSAESQEALAVIYGRPTADRLLKGIPYPSVVNALRIAGVGPGVIKQTEALLCATPYPIQHEGVNWAYATADNGIALDTTGDFGDYTLTVPRGVTAGTGAWASVTETGSKFTDGLGLGLDMDVPAVDAHIYGNWAGYVAVTLPPDPTELGDGYIDTVVHHTGTGSPELHANAGVSIGSDGRLTVAVNDLSILDSVKISARWAAGIDAVVDLAAWAEQTWRDSMGLGTSVRCDPDITGEELPAGESFVVESQMINDRPLTPALDHCVTRHAGSDGVPDVRFGVNRGIVNILDSTTGVTVHDVDTLNSLQGLIFTLVNRDRPANGQPLYLAPGATFMAHPDRYSGSFHIDTDLPDYLLVTAGYWLFDEIGSLTPPGFLDALRNLLVTAPNCVLGIAAAFQGAAAGETQALSAATNAITTLLTCVADSLDEVAPTDIAEWLPINVGQAIFLDRLKRAVAMLKYAKYATVVADAAATTGLNGTVNLSWRPQEPAYPATDSEGRAVVEGCVSKRFSYSEGWVLRIDEVCQDLEYGSFPDVDPPVVGPPVDAFNDWVGEITSLRMYNLLRRDSNGVLHLILLEGGELVAHPIAAQDEWDFKEDWPEDEWRSAEFGSLVDRVGGPAANDPLKLRNFTNGSGHSWLLREANGTAWWIDSAGIRHWLPSVEAQRKVSNSVLTLHPAQWANDVCPYPGVDEPAVRVCG